ncbi:hypothetical protein [Egbenema bharatensis]|uniref:hypothetical protein n=1 Tax=Egbenema bharatensis TaxID=3463334 RepID=UPI003A8C15D9
MTGQLIYQMQQAADAFLRVKAEALKTWQSPCQCSAPGTHDRCLRCPAFRALVQKMQTMLAPDPETVMPSLLPPDQPPADSNAVRQQCCELYACGYTLHQIQWMTGATNLREMRTWLREAGLMSGARAHSSETKAQCLQFYQSGLELYQIEEQTGVSAEVLSFWVRQAGMGRSSRLQQPYSDAEKQQCCELYLQGKSYKAIASITAISVFLIQKWVKETGVQRERIFGGGRPKVYSPEFRQQCLKLLEQGNTPPQIEMMLGVSADTVRRWKKEASR